MHAFATSYHSDYSNLR